MTAKILVVDDSNTIRKAITVFLSQFGCEVATAVDGFDGLAMLAAEKPDLIFLDVMLPRLDGLQTLQIVRKNIKYHDTQVVMLTAKSGLFDQAHARGLGAAATLGKPFSKAGLHTLLAQLLPHHNFGVAPVARNYDSAP